MRSFLSSPNLNFPVCPDTCVVVMLVGELKSKLLLAEGNVKVALELRTISQLLLTLLKFENMK